jgi:hypothetical protein
MRHKVRKIITSILGSKFILTSTFGLIRVPSGKKDVELS